MGEEEKEVSLKDLINRLIDWIKYLFSKWLIIGIVAAVGAGLGVLYAYMAKPVYSASVSFVLSNKSASGGGLMGLASQFGFDFGSNGTDVFSGDNIISLMRSRKMYRKCCLKSRMVKNRF